MRKASFVMMASMVLVGGLASTARADDTGAAPAADKASPDVVVPMKIKGRVARPQVITEVSTLSPAQHLSQLRQPLLDRIEKAIDKSPF